jgi:hypothetical protein
MSIPLGYRLREIVGPCGARSKKFPPDWFAKILLKELLLKAVSELFEATHNFGHIQFQNFFRQHKDREAIKNFRVANGNRLADDRYMMWQSAEAEHTLL